MIFSTNTVMFCLLSFEGPDRYAQAGGLGVRITHLAETLAAQGFETHLLFVGDPHLPGREVHGRLTLHRWGQWISAHHPAGVYAAEEEKLWDFNNSVPPFLIEEIIRPALAQGRLPVILAEEWHTAEALIRLNDQLAAQGLRDRFSSQGWSGWPLMADQYADWLANASGELLVIGWDFETFGVHHRQDSGIFEFMAALPAEVQKRGLSFATPSEALAKYGAECCDLPLPAFASTWAGNGGLEFFLGNGVQQAAVARSR